MYNIHTDTCDMYCMYKKTKTFTAVQTRANKLYNIYSVHFDDYINIVQDMIIRL